MPTPPFPSPRFSRRTAGGIEPRRCRAPTRWYPPVPGYQETASSPAASPAASPVGSPAASPAAASPAGWRTWLLASADELRPAAPGAPSQAEIDEVVAAQADPSEETTAAIARWGSRPGGHPLVEPGGGGLRRVRDRRDAPEPLHGHLPHRHARRRDRGLGRPGGPRPAEPGRDQRRDHPGGRGRPGAVVVPLGARGGRGRGGDGARLPASPTPSPAASTRSPRRRPSRGSRRGPPSAATSRPGSRWGRRSARRRSPAPRATAPTPSGTRRPCRPAPASGSRRRRGSSRRRSTRWPAPSRRGS